MSYKVKVTKKKKPKSMPEPYYECPCCGYQDDIGGCCPNCEYIGHYTDMEFIYPKKSLAEYFLAAAQN